MTYRTLRRVSPASAGRARCTCSRESDHCALHSAELLEEMKNRLGMKRVEAQLLALQSVANVGDLVPGLGIGATTAFNILDNAMVSGD